jgi:hypothetical protein
MESLGGPGSVLVEAVEDDLDSSSVGVVLSSLPLSQLVPQRPFWEAEGDRRSTKPSNWMSSAAKELIQLLAVLLQQVACCTALHHHLLLIAAEKRWIQDGGQVAMDCCPRASRDPTVAVRLLHTEPGGLVLQREGDQAVWSGPDSPGVKDQCDLVGRQTYRADAWCRALV